MAELQIEIVNFDQYNPRGDSKRPSWFRFENNLFTSQSLFELQPLERLVWVFLLCVASQKNSGNISLKIAYAAKMTGVPEKVVSGAIDKLLKEGCILLVDPNSHVTRTNSCEGRTAIQSNIETPCESRNNSPATNERTNITNEHHDSAAPSRAPMFDFESIYRIYPRKEGKSKGIERCKSQIRTEEDFKTLHNAVQKYVKHVREQGIEARFVKHFSSFMSSWRDWIESDTGKFRLGPSPREEAGVREIEREKKNKEFASLQRADPAQIREICDSFLGKRPA